MSNNYFDNSKIEYDVLIVGGGTGSLAMAHRLVDLAIKNGTELSIAVLEKGKEFGAHITSGAVSNPRVIKSLFPDFGEKEFPIDGICDESYFTVVGNERAWNVPSLAVPPGMKKEGYFILSLSMVVAWMADQLREKAKEHSAITVDLLPGFAAREVLYDGDKVTGVQILPAEESQDASNLDHQIYAKVTCFGDKGFLSRDVINKFDLATNPQQWSVGVKEVWNLPEGKSYENKVWHTMGYPLIDGSFGGGFIYGMKNNRLSIGLIASLDSPNPDLNPQQKLQDLKKHPWVQEMLKDATLSKYSAAVLPEGGYYSLPKEFAVDGALFLGDALGVLDISCLSGIDKAMETGCQAAKVVHKAIKSNDFSTLASEYKVGVMESFVGKELFQGRYFRYAWQENSRLLNNYLPTVIDGIDKTPILGPYLGMLMVGLTNNPFQALADGLRLFTLMGGSPSLTETLSYKPDAEHIVPDFVAPHTIKDHTDYQKSTVYSREDAVFYAGTKYPEHTAHIDEFNADTCVKCIEKYDALNKVTPCVSDCTAEVHRIDILDIGKKHGMSLENCIQCRTCEIVCPEYNLRVNASAQGSGPDFMGS